MTTSLPSFAILAKSLQQADAVGPNFSRLEQRPAHPPSATPLCHFKSPTSLSAIPSPSIRTFTSVKVHPFHCEWNTCRMPFSSLDDLVVHLYKVHVANGNCPSSTTDFICLWQECYHTASSPDLLINHLNHTHLSLTAPSTSPTPHLTFACQWTSPTPCDMRFTSLEDLTLHISDAHVGSGHSSYMCSWRSCDRRHRPFAQRQKLMRHIQTHTGDKPYECAMCKKRFSESKIMTQHMRTHSGKLFKGRRWDEDANFQVL
jgi:hypothetical protein